MHRFTTTLVAGTKAPYDSWTFVVISPKVATQLGAGPVPLRGTIAGTPFRGSASRGEGVLRMSVPRALRDAAGVQRGDRVAVELEVDAAPRPVTIPDELRAVFRRHPDVAKLYDAMPPAHRRAWASHVAEAKRPETRVRRASKAVAGIRKRAFPG